MCGIAGLIARDGADADLVTTIRVATDAIAHRGPDDHGTWIDKGARVALGHRRLSIIDLSSAGHQPMQSADARYVLVFNGEIYNHADLRRELESAGTAPVWRGHSDTETLLAAIAAWGLGDALRRATGMFALALWDKAERRLWLARDRFGEKPLYYGWCAAGFAFASELKAIRALPGFDNSVAGDAVGLLLSYGSIPAPLSIHRGIFKLLPGTLLGVPTAITDLRWGEPLSTFQPGGVVFERWYDYPAVVLDGAAHPFTDQHDAIGELEHALQAAVARQLVADVPVGTFLSGGVDSSLITALAARAASKPVRTFSIGFGETGYDEAPFARAVATHLGTDHHELYVTPGQAQQLVPALPALYDEPFADDSALPTYLVSRFARGSVTVALSGDAGDELFGGYNRHRAFPKVWRNASRLPAPLRRLGLGGAAALPPALWRALARGGRAPQVADKLHRLLSITGEAGDFAGLTSGFLDLWHGEPAPATAYSTAYQTERRDLFARLAALPLETQIMAADAMGYLPDTILTKVDRAAMAVGLEGRIPFLDPQVAAIAARVPVAMKFGPRGGKQILRELLDRHVPRALIDRPKAGFTAPIGQWLRGPLRDWAEDLLATSALTAAGLNPTPIRRRWSEHVTGVRDHAESLWAVLMLQAWLAAQR
ncbi:asparagine synthase (glutamine-hydrolyzing) [Sphingomonas sp.]|uniref:asparagine synthase (glutamine-hydrolyzing) n=1 Tax=Sphingomonas sp. TaxID=28214 RepID=UPI0035C793B7